MMTKNCLLGMFRLFRFELPLTAGVCVILGEMLALGRLPGVREAVLGFLSMFCISATALILNDYFDIESDKINAPERPLPAGLVTERDVILLSIVVAGLGFVTSGMIGAAALSVMIVIWMIGFLYNWRYKRTGLPGNLMVCVSVGMTFIFGGITVGIPFEKTVWFFAVITMLIDLGEEIAADAMDIHGDRRAGSRSVAIRFGPEIALKISGAIFFGVVALTMVPFILGWLKTVYAIPLSLMDVVILYSTMRLLDPKEVHRRRFIRWIYLSGLAAFVMFLLIRMLDR